MSSARNELRIFQCGPRFENLNTPALHYLYIYIYIYIYTIFNISLFLCILYYRPISLYRLPHCDGTLSTDKDRKLEREYHTECVIILFLHIIYAEGCFYPTSKTINIKSN
jgi:hypothetical protein